MHRNSENVSTKQERIAALAKQSPQMAFTSLAYLMDINWLKEAYRRTRKDGAAGVDGVTAEEYEQDLEGNLQSLLDRAKSGTYRAPPVRRVNIPKGGSSTETPPLGIPTLEDKLLQRALVMCWSRSTNRTSWTARTASSPEDRRTRGWKHSGSS
jgi:retron-type reverse transcriptase